MATNNHIGWTSVNEDSKLLFYVTHTHTQHTNTNEQFVFDPSFLHWISILIVSDLDKYKALEKNNAITAFIVLVGIISIQRKTHENRIHIPKYYVCNREI